MIKSSGLEPEASLEIAQLPGMLGRGGGEGGLCSASGTRFFPANKGGALTQF